jgi:phosphatidylethanolamine-binding protein (PEBP) family uncharacterized protein
LVHLPRRIGARLAHVRVRIPHPPLVVVVAVLLAGGLAAGCESSDGRSLPPPDPATSVPPPPTAPPPPEPFALQSAAVDPDGRLADTHTCHGEGTSPPLAWTGAPPAEQLAVVARQADEAGTVLWVVTGIDPVVLGFGEGAVPEGAVVGRNAAGAPGWLPPCPDAGGSAAVDIVLHVLAQPLALDPDTPAPDAAGAVEAASTDSVALRTTATA